MKKIFILLLLLIPFFALAKENVYIDSIELEENQNVEIVSPATAEGLNLDLNLKFKYLDSYVKYKMIVMNKTKENYELEKNIIESDNKTIKYELSCDGNNVIQPGKSKTCSIIIKYAYPVFFSVLKETNNSVKDENQIQLNLIGMDNPNTSSNTILFVIFFFLFVSILLYKIFYKKGLLFGSIIIAILLPVIIYAYNVVTINIHSRIEIVGNVGICSHVPNTTREFMMCELEELSSPIIGEYYARSLSQEGILKADTISIKKAFEDFIEWETSINDYPDEVMEQLNHDLLENWYYWDIFKNNSDWDYTPEFPITSENYRNHNDGIYLDDHRLVPLFKPSTITDYLEYVDFRVNRIQNHNEEDFNYPLKDSTIRDVSGYSFLKPDGTNNTRIRNLYNNTYMLESDGQKRFVFAGSIDNTVSMNLWGEMEDVDVYGRISIMVGEEIDPSTGTIHYSAGNINTAPEYVSRTLFHSRFDAFSDLSVLYSSYVRNKSVNISVSHYLDMITYLKKYFEELKDFGYIDDEWDDIVSGNGSDIVKEYLRWLGNPDLSQYDSWKSQYDAARTKNEKETVNAAFYNYYGLTISELENDIKVIYNDILYEGRKGYFDFLNEYFQFDVVYDMDEEKYENDIISLIVETVPYGD